VKQVDAHESEDHAGALCEIMALISGKPNNESYAAQATFFQQHIAPWMMDFFEDLRSTGSARLYQAVGLFGSCFLKAESEYLGLMQTPGFMQQKEG
jgi:TorA maturation chaperone TorD